MPFGATGLAHPGRRWQASVLSAFRFVLSAFRFASPSHLPRHFGIGAHAFVQKCFKGAQFCWIHAGELLGDPANLCANQTFQRKGESYLYIGHGSARTSNQRIAMP